MANGDNGARPVGGGETGVGSKVGPLPVWAWFLVAAGIFGVFLLLRRRGGATTTPGGSRLAGVSQVDPLTGEQLLTALQDLTTILKQSQSGPSSNPFMGEIRGPGAVPGYDQTHMGVPLHAGTFFSDFGHGNVGLNDDILAFIPWGSKVEILGTRLGDPNFRGGVTQWFRVRWGGIEGWISAFDFLRFFGSPPPDIKPPVSPDRLFDPGPVKMPPPIPGSTVGTGSVATVGPPAILAPTEGAKMSIARLTR